LVSIVPGLSARDGGSLLLAAVILGIVNAIIRPLALVLSIPLTNLTFRLFVLVVNAAMLGLAGLLVPGFAISGFWAALFGALVVSVVSAAFSGALAGR
jgi:putative membrane protein